MIMMLLICHHPPQHITGGVYPGLDYFHNNVSCFYTCKGRATIIIRGQHHVQCCGDRVLLSNIALPEVKFPQQIVDLLFDKSFTLSHNWEKGVVSIAGYISEQPNVSDEFLPDYVDGDKGKELVVDELTKKEQARKLDSKEVGKKASGSGKGWRVQQMRLTSVSCKWPL